MFFRWHGRPALMFPGRAFCVDRPGDAWFEIDYRDVSREASSVSQDDFWREFGGWQLPGFPGEFALLERRAEHFRPIRTRARRLRFL